MRQTQLRVMLIGMIGWIAASTNSLAYYNPGTGRWLSRDPIEERGEKNLYQALNNVPQTTVDRNGLDNWSNPIRGENTPPPAISYPLVSPSINGFQVVGSVIRTWYGKILHTVGVEHVDIGYNGKVVYVGRGGGDERRTENYVRQLVTRDISVRTSGKMKFGRLAGCSCKGVTDDDVLSCLYTRKPISGRNCHGDIQDAVKDCCLSGFVSLVGSFSPNLSGN